MRFELALARHRERVAAAAGQDGPGFGQVVIDDAPEKIATRLLVGRVSLDDLPMVLASLMDATAKTIAGVMQSESPDEAATFIYTALSQTMGLGIQLGEPEPEPQGSGDGG